MIDTFTDYNRFTNIPNFSINIINYLIDNNETIWKLLKYPENDALNQPNLTEDEKTSLIYDGSGMGNNYLEQEQNFRVFTKSMPSDALPNQCSQLHIFLDGLIPINHIVGQANMIIQIISHNAILTLNNGWNRNEVILQEMLATLNGAYIEGITQLSFDRSGNGYSNEAKQGKFADKWYEGFNLIMSCKVSNISSNAGE